jgi:anti-sigma regulatory factor (Ser/Thr protein kinase)
MKEITVPAKIEFFEEVISFVKMELESVCCPAKTQNKINIVIDEIFTNIANYAYPSAVPGKVIVRTKIEGEPLLMELHFIDEGTPYNPLEKEKPDITLSAEERNIGGLGILIVKEIMDSIEYRYKDEKNILILKKFLV